MTREHQLGLEAVPQLLGKSLSWEVPKGGARGGGPRRGPRGSPLPFASSPSAPPADGQP